MSTDRTPPFTPGQRVALVNSQSFHDPTYQEAFVEKVYKNGRFVLRGPSGQYRPEYCHNFGDPEWRAYRAGDSRYRSAHAVVWDDRVDSIVQAAVATAERRRRWYRIQDRVASQRFYDETITDTMLDQIEAALPADPEGGDSP